MVEVEFDGDPRTLAAHLLEVNFGEPVDPSKIYPRPDGSITVSRWKGRWVYVYISPGNVFFHDVTMAGKDIQRWQRRYRDASEAVRAAGLTILREEYDSWKTRNSAKRLAHTPPGPKTPRPRRSASS